MRGLPKRQPGSSLETEIVRDAVKTIVDEGSYQPYVRPDGQPGLRLTQRGEAAGYSKPVSQHD